MKIKNVGWFFGIIFSTCVMEYWKHIPPAPQYSFSIVFLYTVNPEKTTSIIFNDIINVANLTSI